MRLGELTETAGSGTKRATEERTRGKVRQTSHEGPLGEERRAFSEKRAFPHLSGLGSARGKAEERGQGFWDAEELDPDRSLGWCTGIASQPLWPRETIMRPLRTGQGGRGDVWTGRAGLIHLYLHALVTQELDAHTPMKPSAPVSPEQGSRTDHQGMQQYAHLARLSGDAALPLTLFA